MGKIKKAVRFIRGLFPSNLPTGSQAFDDFAASIFQTYNLPDMPSYRHAIAGMIMHLGPTVHTKSKYFFASSVRKAMANQVAYDKIQTIKYAEKKEKTEVENDGATSSEQLA